MAFQLKGSDGNGGSKTKRTTEQKIEVLALTAGGMKGVDALAQVFGETAPPSYANHAHSIIGGFKTAISKKLAANCAETIALALAAGLCEETSSDEAPAEELELEADDS